MQEKELFSQQKQIHRLQGRAESFSRVLFLENKEKGYFQGPCQEDERKRKKERAGDSF